MHRGISGSLHIAILGDKEESLSYYLPLALSYHLPTAWWASLMRQQVHWERYKRQAEREVSQVKELSSIMHHTVGLAAVGRAGLEVTGGGGGATAGTGSSHDGAAGFDAAAGLGALGTGGVADAELGPYHGLSITSEFGHFNTYWPGASPKFV